MNGWTDNELASTGAVHEVGIALYLEDGTLRRYTIIWVVRVADNLYVRSWRGRSGGWFRVLWNVLRAAFEPVGLEYDVTFEKPGDGLHSAIDQAYRRKYALASDTYVQPMINAEAAAATFRLVPVASR